MQTRPKKNNRIPVCCMLNLFQQFIDSLTSNGARRLFSIRGNNDRMSINNGNIVQHMGKYHSVQ